MSKVPYQISMFEENNHEILKRYLCSICKNVLKDPVCDVFSHVFCRQCIMSHIEMSDQCPIMNDHPISARFLNKMDIMEQFLMKMTVFCPERLKGCQFKDTLRNLENHLVVCPFVESEVVLNKQAQNTAFEEEKQAMPSFEFEQVESVSDEKIDESELNQKVESFLGEKAEKENENVQETIEREESEHLGEVKQVSEHELAEYFERPVEQEEIKQESKLKKLKCLFSDLGCEELIDQETKLTHFQKNNYEHLFMLTNFINSKFVSLEKKFEGLIKAVEHANNPYQVTELNDGLLSKKKEKNEASLSTFTLKFVSPGLEVLESLIKCVSAKKPYLFSILDKEVLGWFSMKIELLADVKWMGFGLVDWEIFNENKQTFMHKSGTHGFYLFSSNGFKYNLTEQSKTKLKEFPAFGKHDIIKLEVDQNKKELKCIIGNCKWKIKDIDLSRTLYPCAIFTEEGEAFRILSIKH